MIRDYFDCSKPGNLIHLILKCDQINLFSKGRRPKRTRNEKTKFISTVTGINAQAAAFHLNSFPSSS